MFHGGGWQYSYTKKQFWRKLMFKQIIRDKRQPPTREENPWLSSAGTSPFLMLTQEIYSHSNLSEERKEFKLTSFLPSCGSQ